MVIVIPATSCGPETARILSTFDDCRSGPAIQDLWMLLSGERHEMQIQLGDIVLGYDQFFHFNASCN
jgi:hypothetical protein